MMKKMPLGMIAFLQAAGLALYVSLVALLIWQGSHWFDQLNSYLGPLLFLTLFVFSATVCTLIFLGYPFWLVWEGKQTRTALRLVFYSTAWLLAFLLVLLGFIAFR